MNVERKSKPFTIWLKTLPITSLAILFGKYMLPLSWATEILLHHILYHTTLLISQMDPLKYLFEKACIIEKIGPLASLATQIWYYLCYSEVHERASYSKSSSQESNWKIITPDKFIPGRINLVHWAKRKAFQLADGFWRGGKYTWKWNHGHFDLSGRWALSKRLNWDFLTPTLWLNTKLG